MKVYLCGRHANRTPLSYEVYRPLFSRHLTYVDKPEDADFIVLGWLRYIQEHAEEIHRALNVSPHIKIVILSEEPLWDSVWGEHYGKKIQNVLIGNEKIKCHFLNHQTTNIYDFERIPYFITTNDHYMVRYHSLFSQNVKLSRTQMFQSLDSAPIKVAFYAEHKLNEKYAVKIPEHDVQGLSVYRTKLAYDCSAEEVVKVGLGWNKQERRQDLPDWHLDKLSSLNRQSKIVSAIENTHQINYVTEKIFDAFAVLSVPLYYASGKHRINDIVGANSYINLYNKTVPEATGIIGGHHMNKNYINAYQAAQMELKELFSDYDVLHEERERVVSSVLGALEQL